MGRKFARIFQAHVAILLMSCLIAPCASFRIFRHFSSHTKSLSTTYSNRRVIQKLYMSTTSASVPPVPRAAVSVCVRCQCKGDDQAYFLLVQRGKKPNKGQWSLPGGKLEYGEDTVTGGMRELAEETKWSSEGDSDVFSKLKWYDGTVMTSDSIGEGFHYVIAHCFAEINGLKTLPKLEAADDAADADWFSLAQVEDLAASATPGLLPVMQRIQDLANSDFLPTDDED